MRLKLDDNSCPRATPGTHSHAGRESCFNAAHRAFATKQRRESGRIVVTVGKKA